MNDHEPLDAHDPRLSERMQRAVGGLSAPDVIPRALARGRRQRTRRRLVHAGGGIVAATALAISVPTIATHLPGQEQDPSGPPVAAGPAAAAVTGGSQDDPCGASATGWWSKPTAQVEADLSALLPEGTVIGKTSTTVAGTWSGTLVAGDHTGAASLTLLPPPGVPGPRRTLEELSAGGPCAGGRNEPLQAVEPCDELTGLVACEELRSEDGTLVGIVTEKARSTVVDGREQPTDQTYLLSAITGPQGGHVELVVGEGSGPVLTLGQVRAITTSPVWTS